MASNEAAMKQRTGQKTQYGLRWVLTRLLVAFLVVFLTYNPTGYSYVHWLLQFDGTLLPLKILIGISLFILMRVFFNMTFAVFRLSGLFVGVIVAGLFSHYVLKYTLSEQRLESMDGYLIWFGYLASMTVALVMGAGTSWAQIMTRLSGQEYKRFMGNP
ncbi:MAG: hypothetical protein HN377_00045 [Alphaproteobacteria bacterium]|jgi:hypothetical protein|nr:hypothetical protein [Alphaproteobacteria bacterium]MBT4566055.1 hypothetical protein [Rhodospirillaceae bacterium]MBT7157328.1 hypothetical protein [Rhodospirillaceae bacterium]